MISETRITQLEAQVAALEAEVTHLKSLAQFLANTISMRDNMITELSAPRGPGEPIRPPIPTGHTQGQGQS